ncbi:MAG: HlyC/CorC family transporter [Firmicutes bacterium]|nr:HlyC/CorC family transporter [Candidatus Fermentithermobacillaceae bacterium]
MDDPGGSSYLLALCCLVLSAYFSGSESAIFSSDEVRLKSKYPGNKRAQQVLGLKKNPNALLSSILLGNTLVNILFSSTFTVIVYSLLPKSQGLAEALSVVFGTALVLLFGEITPKLLAGSNPEALAVRVVGSLTWLQLILKPFTTVLEKVASLFAWLLPKPDRDPEEMEEMSEARVMAALEYGEDTGAISYAEKEIIAGVIDSRDIDVSEVMVPRPRMIAIEEQASALEALKLMLREGFSRIPVYHGSKDNITGIANIKSLAIFLGERPSDWEEALADIPVKQFAVEPYFVPESKNVSDLLQEMKALGVHMAIVVDEYDGVSGLVTIEDLIEEFVGDIQDEYDSENMEYEVLGEGRWRMPGSISLVELEDFTGIEIDNEDCDSLAGLVMMCLGRVPVPGDAFCLIEPKVCFTVEDVKGPRITEVLVERIEGETGQI